MCFTAWCYKVLSALVCVCVCEIGPLIPVWPGKKAAYCEAVPLRASRLRVNAPTETHMRTCIQPVLHTSLSLAKCFCFLFWYISRYSIFHRPFCRKLTCPIKPCLQPDSLSPKQSRSSSAVCRLPPLRPSLSSLCRLHYSPLIVKSFCSISTHPFYKHTLLIFLFFMYSLQISHHNVLFGSAVFLKTSQSFDLWSFGINFLQSYI